MIERNKMNLIILGIIIAGLFALAIMTIFPIFQSIIYGLLLAYIFYPAHKFLVKRLKNRFFSAFLICFVIFLFIITMFVLILPPLLRQIIDIYILLQKISLSSSLKSSIPDFLLSFDFVTKAVESSDKFLLNFLQQIISKFSDYILKMPFLIIHLFITSLIFFIMLKDGDKISGYFRSLLPFKSEINNEIEKKFKEVTNSILFGQLLAGFVQGILCLMAFYIIGIPNLLLISVITIILSLIPMIGAWIGWVSVDIYLFATGRILPAIILLIFGILVVSTVDNIIRIAVVSKRTNINIGIILAGMISGLILYGFLGLIIVPLILAYALLAFEIYGKSVLDKKT